MKRSIKIFAIVLMIGIAGILPHQASASAPFGVSFQVFYNELSPFGDWVMDPTHGYVWIPYVDAQFHPYASHGRWVMTSFGNTWVSDYSWGWAPFHYGRWFWSDFYGWAWVPGYEWGPAWVSWRSGGGFYGWAPLGPGLHVNVGFGIPSAHWVFIPQRRFRHRHFNRYFISHHRAVNVFHQTTIINNTTVINNNTFYIGPSRREIERVTNSRVPVYTVQESNRPGRAVVRSNSVEMYRPQIQSDRNSREVVRPATAYSQDEFRSRNAARGGSSNQGRAVAPASRTTGVNDNGRNSQAGTAQTPSRVNSSAGNTRNAAVNRGTDATANPSRVGTTNQSRQNSNRNEGVGTAPANRNSSSAPAVRNNSQNRGSSAAPAVRNAPARNSGNNQSSTVTRSQSTAPKASMQAPSRNQSVKAPAANNRSAGQVNTQRSTNNRSSAASKPNVAPSRNSGTSNASKPSVAPSRNSSNSSGTSSSSRSSSNNSSRNRGNN